mgnify:CR=1 FL=1
MCAGSAREFEEVDVGHCERDHERVGAANVAELTVLGDQHPGHCRIVEGHDQEPPPVVGEDPVPTGAPGRSDSADRRRHQDACIAGGIGQHYLGVAALHGGADGLPGGTDPRVESEGSLRQLVRRDLFHLARD